MSLKQDNQQEVGSDNVVQLDLLIRRSTESVRRWWTEFPDDYRAVDPREQPHRIVTTRRTSDDRELTCFWRNPDGTERQTQETMRVTGEGSWSFDVVHPNGLKNHDEFTVTPVEEGTRVQLKITLVPKPGAEEAFRALKERVSQGSFWKNVAAICERDAP